MCQWKLDNIGPAEAIAKLQMRTEPHIKHWLRGLDNPADAVGKIQRKYLKDLRSNARDEFDEIDELFERCWLLQWPRVGQRLGSAHVAHAHGYC